MCTSRLIQCLISLHSRPARPSSFPAGILRERSKRKLPTTTRVRSSRSISTLSPEQSVYRGPSNLFKYTAKQSPRGLPSSKLFRRPLVIWEVMKISSVITRQHTSTRVCQNHINTTFKLTVRVELIDLNLYEKQMRIHSPGLVCDTRYTSRVLTHRKV